MIKIKKPTNNHLRRQQSSPLNYDHHFLVDICGQLYKKLDSMAFNLIMQIVPFPL